MSTFINTLNVHSTGSTPAQQYTTIAANNTSIVNWADVDHIGFNVTPGGTHEKCSMPNHAAFGLVLGTDGVYYVNNNVPMFENSTHNDYHIDIYRGTPVSASNGTSFLPGGIMIQWGSVSSPGSSGTITYPTAFTTIYNVVLTPRNDGSHSAFTYYLDGAPGNADFKYRGTTSGSDTLYWLAIGAV